MITGSNIYSELKRRGLSHSRRHASRDFFGSADNYLCLRGDRGPSERALIYLFRRLWPTHPIFALRIAWMILFEERREG